MPHPFSWEYENDEIVAIKRESRSFPKHLWKMWPFRRSHDVSAPLFSAGIALKRLWQSQSKQFQMEPSAGKGTLTTKGVRYGSLGLRADRSLDQLLLSSWSNLINPSRDSRGAGANVGQISPTPFSLYPCCDHWWLLKRIVNSHLIWMRNSSHNITFPHSFNNVYNTSNWEDPILYILNVKQEIGRISIWICVH